MDQAYGCHSCSRSGNKGPKNCTRYNDYSLLLFWCPYMVINISVQCNGGLLPDVILFTL